MKTIFEADHTESAYTPWRRFLAWVGFASLFIWLVLLASFIVWANNYINLSASQQSQTRTIELNHD